MSFNPNAKAFVPSNTRSQAPVVKRSARYMGSQDDYERIKAMFELMLWGQGVHTVYVTNGWHTGFEGGRTVWYCGYAVNEDNEIYKQHFYAAGQ
jgi:hypothetical protein